MWQSADPILGKYLPSLKNGRRLPEVAGGVFDAVNIGLYSYGGLNPLKYIDPDGEAKIVIDPGHGGTDSGGGTNKKFKEKDITLSVSRMVSFFLTLRGHDTSLTRTSGSQLPSLKERAQTANKAKADFFVSIHVDNLPDSTRDPKESRISALYQKNADGTIRADQKAFAEAIVENIDIDGTRDVSWGGNFGVLRNLDEGGPTGALIEIGNAKSPTDTKRLDNFFSRLLHAWRLSGAIDSATNQQQRE